MALEASRAEGIHQTEHRLHSSESRIGIAVVDRDIEDQLIKFLAEGIGGHDALLQRGLPDADHLRWACRGRGHVLGEIQQSGQGSASLVLEADAVGEHLLISGKLSFSLQHFKLGGDTSLKAGAGVFQAHQGSPHRLLTDPHLLIGALKIEIGLCCFQPSVPKSDQVGITSAFKIVASCSNPWHSLGVDEIPLNLGRKIGRPLAAGGVRSRGRYSGRGIDRACEIRIAILISGEVLRQTVSGEIDRGIPEGNLGKQSRLGLLHLTGRCLEAWVVDLHQLLGFRKGERTEFTDPHLRRFVWERQTWRRLQGAQRFRERGGSRGQNGRIGFRTRSLELDGGREGLLINQRSRVRCLRGHRGLSRCILSLQSRRDSRGQSTCNEKKTGSGPGHDRLQSAGSLGALGLLTEHCGHDVSCSMHDPDRDRQSCLHLFQGHVIEKHRRPLSEHHRGQ